MTSTANAANVLVSFTDIEAGLKLMLEVFGFEEGMIFRNDDGFPEHCELHWGTSIVMPAQRKPDSPWTLGPCSVFLSTTDPDGLHEKVVQAGLEIVMPLTDQPYGSREFAAKDDSGNVWIFGTYQAGALPA